MPDPGPSRVPEFVPLCEKCGYVIESLPEDSACPECGRPIASSLAKARPGSAWQTGRGSGVARWLATAAEIRRKPSELFTRIRIGDPRDPALMRWSLLIASATLATVLAGAILLDPGLGMSQAGAAAFAAMAWLLVTPTGVILLRGLTYIEERGLRFFGTRHGFRISPAVARSVCAHAAVGWALGAILGAFVTIALWLLLFWPVGLATRLAPMYGGRPPPTWSADALGLAFGAGAALLWFETLAYIGMRKCRYANRGVGRGESGDGEAEPDAGTKTE
ncbi:MAG: hypothetical protein EA423_04540 [Phycisphaerales bacterium]|nr:MAG: hypothetical protein EA423_04540 [Phycisphaerales bacterium]